MIHEDEDEKEDVNPNSTVKSDDCEIAYDDRYYVVIDHLLYEFSNESNPEEPE